jgi:hypothetical protein
MTVEHSRFRVDLWCAPGEDFFARDSCVTGRVPRLQSDDHVATVYQDPLLVLVEVDHQVIQPRVRPDRVGCGATRSAPDEEPGI